MDKKQVAKRFRELASDVMKPWSEAHGLLMKVDGKHNRLMQKGCSVKSPSLEAYDALYKMADQLDLEAKNESNNNK